MEFKFIYRYARSSSGRYRVTLHRCSFLFWEYTLVYKNSNCNKTKHFVVTQNSIVEKEMFSNVDVPIEETGENIWISALHHKYVH